MSRLDADGSALVRTNEAEWKALNADIEDPDQVVRAILDHPKILQRPIADDGQRAVIGRPPEDVLGLLD